MFELLPGPGVEGHIGVQGEALQAGAPGPGGVDHRGGRAKTAHGMAGPRTGGDELLDRGSGVAGQQRHLLSYGIGRVGVVRQAPAAPQQTSDAIVDLLQELGDLLVRGGRQRVEHGKR
jgi:hypothetical protein